MVTIAWDVDDVLNDLTGAWLRDEWRPAHPQCRTAYSELSRNPPHSIIGAALEEYLASLDRFRRSRYRELEPLPETLAWFERHGGRFRHMALTAAPLHCAPESAEWVIRHFGRWIRSFNFVPSPRHGESIPPYDANKRDFLRWFGNASVLVDDNVENIAAARSAGMRAVLMPRPWNSGPGSIGETFEQLETLQ